MALRMGYLAIAISLTVFDGIVTVRYGIPLWIAWSGNFWRRGLVVVLAALEVTTLLDIWAQTILRARCIPEAPKAVHHLVASAVPLEPRGEHHV